MFRFYHQLGHRYKWSIDSLTKDGAGDGVIIAPRYMSPKEVESLQLKLRSTSFFDPQFLIRNSFSLIAVGESLPNTVLFLMLSPVDS